VHTPQQIIRNPTRKIAKLPPRTPGIETTLPAKSRRKLPSDSSRNQAEEFRSSLASQTEKLQNCPKADSVSVSVAALGAIPELQNHSGAGIQVGLGSRWDPGKRMPLMTPPISAGTEGVDESRL
jgi:hypothetical protein